MEGVEGLEVVFVHRNARKTAAESGELQGSARAAWWRSGSCAWGKKKEGLGA